MRHCILAEPAGLSTTLAYDRDELLAGWDDRDAPRHADRGFTEWRGLADLHAIVPHWRSLIADALEPNVFYDPAFALSAAPVFGTDAGAILVWSGDTARRLIGLFSVAIARRRYGIPLPVLSAWTHAYAPLGVALVARDAADAAIEAFLDHVGADLALPKILLLPFVPLEGPFATTLRRVIARRRGTIATFDRHARAQLRPGDARADYIERAIGAKRRKEMRRQSRRLAERAPVTLATASEPEAIGRALEDFLALEAAGWKGRRGTAVARHADLTQFLQHALRGLAAEGLARIDRLMWRDRAIAAAIVLRSADTGWFFKIAYDETVARASPGVQLALDMTTVLLADPTIARVDSCAVADHPMIDHLWRERLEIGDLLVRIGPDRTATFAAACRLESARRTTIAAAKRVLSYLRGRRVRKGRPQP
jgi:CelD/BcsL family acetyltransferase involved in cellulose biosynthesis